MACTWFGEICSCCCLACRNKFHQATYKPYFRALYILYIPVGDDFAVLVFLVVLLRLIGMLDDIVGLNKAGVRTIV